MKAVKTAAAYIRVSTAQQTELSPDSQLREIRKYAEHNQIRLLDEYIFIEEGISGRSTEKREKFLKMLSTAKTKPKPFDMILLWKFSRFARNREDSIVYKSMLRKSCGIDVVSVSEDLGDNKTSVLIEALIEAMDEYYSINLSSEVKRGMLEKAGRGGAVTIPAFGYKMKDKQYVIDEEKAAVVRGLFDDYLNGAGLRTLAAELNNREIPTARGGRWENRTIEYILRNPVYAGKIRWNPERKTRRNYGDKDIIITQGMHEPIIDEYIFEKVQERLERVKLTFRKGEHQTSSQSGFMLKGLVQCSNCGAVLTQAVKGTRLQCCNYAHGKCTVSHSIALTMINEAVLKQINNDIEDFGFNIAPVVFYNNEKNHIQKQILNLNKKLNRVKDAYDNGVYALSDFKKRKEKIEVELNKLEAWAETEKALPKDSSFKKSEQKILRFLNEPDIPETEKNAVLRQIVNRIVFNRSENKICLFYQ